MASAASMQEPNATELQMDTHFQDPPSPSSSSVSDESLRPLKRASESLEDDESETRRKRLRELHAHHHMDMPARSSGAVESEGYHSESEGMVDDLSAPAAVAAQKAPALSPPANLEEELALELNCACCTELCYNPVVVSPCQHFFCGSCCVLWIENGGTNCPACRSAATAVTPSRPLQSIVDILVRCVPSRARSQRERSEADEIYKAGSSIRLPSPKQPSPEPNVSQSGPFARPCSHCLAGNQYGWRCPVPIPDPANDPEHAFSLDDGVPEGHAYCGNCDHLHATGAPTSSKCDFCQTSFCGISVPSRCIALALLSQQPHALQSLSDLIETREVYDLFSGNIYEVDILLEYMRAQGMTPKRIYTDIIQWTSAQPGGFAPLIAQGVFVDRHPSGGSSDPDPNAPRRKVCRECAAEIFFSSLHAWWIRERTKGLLDDSVKNRPNCKDGEQCDCQTDLAHAKEFNHILPDGALTTLDLPQPVSELTPHSEANAPAASVAAVDDQSNPPNLPAPGDLLPFDAAANGPSVHSSNE